MHNFFICSETARLKWPPGGQNKFLFSLSELLFFSRGRGGGGKWVELSCGWCYCYWHLFWYSFCHLSCLNDFPLFDNLFWFIKIMPESSKTIFSTKNSTGGFCGVTIEIHLIIGEDKALCVIFTILVSFSQDKCTVCLKG